MDIAAVVVSVRVGADNGLVSVEMLGTKFLAQCLRPVYGQAVVRCVPWVKGNDIVVAFHIFPFWFLPYRRFARIQQRQNLPRRSSAWLSDNPPGV